MTVCDSLSCDCIQQNELTLKQQKLLSLALLLVVSFAGVEWLMGWWSHSLSLQADAGHLLSDAIALGLAVIASAIARQSQWRKLPIEGISALINSLSLVVMSVMIVWEAILHLQHPPTEILSLPMLITAIVGLLVNTVNICLLHNHSHQNLNLRGAFLHTIADTISSLAVIIAAIAIWRWHWTWADTVLGFVVAGFIASSALPLLWQSYQQLFLAKARSSPLLPPKSNLETTNSLASWNLNNFAQKIENSSKLNNIKNS